MAAFGGPVPAWLRGTRGTMRGEVGVPLAWNGSLADGLLEQMVATVRVAADAVTVAGFELSSLVGTGELRGREFAIDTSEPTRLNQGAFGVGLRVDLGGARLPSALTLRWNGGQLQTGAIELLRYAVPLFAGLDGEAAHLTGQCDLQLSLQGPARLATGQNWLQLLDEWAGSGTLGLREAAVTPAPALSGLLTPFGELTGADTRLGDAGRLAIDRFEAPFRFEHGAIETQAGTWLAKGKQIGLSGTARLDGGLDYGFDLSALLRGHRDGERVLKAIHGTLPAARLTGSLDSPSLGLPDVGALLQQVLQGELQDRGRDLLQRELDKLLKRKS